MSLFKRTLAKLFASKKMVLSLFHNNLEYCPAGRDMHRSIREFLISIRPESQKLELVRIGSKHDGGYLVPDVLKGIKYCYSPGVSNNSDFEEQLTNYGIECFLADHSVEGPPKDNPLFHFTKRFIGNKIDDKTITLEKWINNNKFDKEMILQMDIEGTEYQVILETPIEVICKFRILIIEFHGFDYLANQYGFDLISSSFYKILKEFRIVHVHGNNNCRPVPIAGEMIPPVMEFTLLRKDHFHESDKLLKLPHKLDSPNSPRIIEVNLPELMW
jgi:hypothetical protein